MNEDGTQGPRLTAVEILELTEQMNILIGQMSDIAERMLDLAIPIESEADVSDEDWTIERFEALVPEFHKGRYEEQNRSGELYELG